MTSFESERYRPVPTLAQAARIAADRREAEIAATIDELIALLWSAIRDDMRAGKWGRRGKNRAGSDAY